MQAYIRDQIEGKYRRENGARQGGKSPKPVEPETASENGTVTEAETPPSQNSEEEENSK